MDVATVRADLLAEQDALDEVVERVTDEQWAAATASPGWSVADQIAHLTYFDGTAALAIANPDAFQELVRELMAAKGADDFTLGRFRTMSPSSLIAAWRDGRADLAKASATLEDDDRVDWYGPSMGAKSFLTARLMEAWAHGQDVAAAVGATLPPSDRMKHIARLGFITVSWSYANRGLEAPTEPVRVTLTSPAGQTWNFGPENASESVSGTSLDFCLVVTQRRHIDDTELIASPIARNWLLIAQAFAGPPTDGPSPG